MAVTASDLAALRAILGPQGLIEDPERRRAAGTDWLGEYGGLPAAVLAPATVEEVSRALAYASAHALAVVPQGGNTGLAGGSVPEGDELVLSLGRMRAVRRLDAQAGVVVAEAGIVLSELERVAGEAGWRVPVDLAARDSAQLGGVLATNAGGVRYLRDGPLHGSVLGLEVVLADGTVLDGLSVLPKNNTGYHLKNLFLGSEGTLGVITAASLALRPADRVRATALLSLADLEGAATVVTRARRDLGALLAAAELMEDGAMRAVLRHVPDTRLPVAQAPAYLLLEAASAAPSDPAVRERLLAVAEGAMGAGLAVDAVLAGSEGEARALWRLREMALEGAQRAGSRHMYDVSLPAADFGPFVRHLRGELGERLPGWDVLVYGHAGDGNLHLNAVRAEGAAPAGEEDGWRRLDEAVYGVVAAHAGSISAEHGIGRAKRDYLGLSRTPAEIALMWRIKRALDPTGCLNPGKVLPPVAEGA